MNAHIVAAAIPPDLVADALAALTPTLATTPYEQLPFTKRVLDVLDLDPVTFGAILAALPLDGIATLLGSAFRIGSFHAHAALPVDLASLPPGAAADYADYAVHIDYPFWLDDVADAVDDDNNNNNIAAEPRATIHPSAALTVQMLVMLTEFKPSTGATRLVPGSSDLRRAPRRAPSGALHDNDAAFFASGAEDMVGSPGDVLVYSGQDWQS